MERSYASEDELRNADLSELDFSEMTEEERREMKRRYNEFVGAFAKPAKKDAPEAKKEVKKWQPQQAFPAMRKR